MNGLAPQSMIQTLMLTRFWMQTAYSCKDCWNRNKFCSDNTVRDLDIHNRLKQHNLYETVQNEVEVGYNKLVYLLLTESTYWQLLSCNIW